MRELNIKLDLDRKNAKHGEFFFAKFLLYNGNLRESPVFVVSAESNDKEDVIICKCTGKPAKSEYDIKVNLKKETHVRTNKIYTVNRNQLLFKINQIAQPDEYIRIIEKLKQTLGI